MSCVCVAQADIKEQRGNTKLRILQMSDDRVIP